MDMNDMLLLGSMDKKCEIDNVHTGSNLDKGMLQTEDKNSMDHTKEIVPMAKFEYSSWKLDVPPEGSMNDGFLASVTAEFKGYIDEHFWNQKHFPFLIREEHRVHQFPVIKYQKKPLEDSYICILDMKSHTIQKKKYLKIEIENMIKCLIFINTSVLRYLHDTNPNQEELSSHKELISWFFRESFKSNHHLPILGTAPSYLAPKKGEEFSEVQRIALDQLSSGEGKKNCFENSILIGGMWYKMFKPDLWEKLENNHTGTCPLVTLKSIVGQAMNSRMQVYQGSFNKDSDFDLIGDLKIPNLYRFPNSMKPQYYRKYPERVEIDLISQSCIFQKKRFFETLRIPINGIPVVMIPEINNAANNRYRVSLINDKGEKINPKKLKNMLGSLFFHLNLCQKYILSEGLIVIDHAENFVKDFSEFFFKLLLNKEEGRFPIFGEIIKEDDKFEISNFSDLQIFLIKDYFTLENPQPNVIRVSLALIYYWYSKYHPKTFSKVREDYWDLVMKELGAGLMKTSKLDVYSLTHFDPDLNFLGHFRTYKSAYPK
jgi:hypothetical protein